MLPSGATRDALGRCCPENGVRLWPPLTTQILCPQPQEPQGLLPYPPGTWSAEVWTLTQAGSLGGTLVGALPGPGVSGVAASTPAHGSPPTSPDLAGHQS